MGLLSNSASFVRYTVEGEMPENFWDFAAERIAQHVFRDIDDNFEEFGVGWVSVANLFDTEFAYASYAAGDYIALSMRCDERKISAAAVRKFCLKEEERLKKEKQLPKISRGQKLEIKENVKIMLMKKAVPLASTYDICWNLAEQTLYFFAINQAAQALLEDLFKATFDLHLVLQIPYLTAAHLLGPEEEKALANLTPTIFV